MHRLHDHERIALAQGPQLLAERAEPSFLAARPGQRPDQHQRVTPRERGQREAAQDARQLELVQKSREPRNGGEVLFPRRHAEQHRRVACPPRQEAEQADRHLVGPVQVFEQDHDRLSRGQPADQPGDALEQPDHVLARRRGPGHADFGQQRRQLASPGLGQRAERLLVRSHLPAAKRIDPRRQGQHLLVLVAATEEHPGPAPERLGGQRRHQAALADAGLADDRHEVTPASRRLLERPAQLPELHVAAEERRLVSGRLWDGHARRGRQPVARCRAAGSLAEQFVVELLRLRLRLDPELTLEHADALLVLPERGPSSARLGVQPHQRPVRRLLEWVQPEQCQPRLDGGVGLAGLPVLRQELGQPLQRQLPEPFPLPQQPLLEPARPLHAPPRQQVPPVERRRRGQRRRRPLGDAPLERRHVDLHRRRVQRDRVAFHAHPADG